MTTAFFLFLHQQDMKKNKKRQKDEIDLKN
jgi:hypothetical protein